MRAAQIDGYGGKAVMRTVDDADKPVIGADQVLIEVHAAGVNPFDYKTREGMTRSFKELDFPATLGGDFAGVVVEVGADVTDLKTGDEVYGQADALSGNGSFAEFTPAKAASTAAKPRSADFATAAALPLTGVSAYQALVEHMSLQNGQRILIHGGAGGIGTIAIQLAKHMGAYVVTTVATDDTEYVRKLGANEVIDYQSQAFEEVTNNYDTVFDTIGGETYTKSYQVLKPGGVLVSMLEQPEENLMKQHEVKAISQFTQVTTERLTRLAELVDQGAIKVHIDKAFPLSEASEALEYLKSGAHRGKVVIEVK
jgi:NADPH:quinone reductase-like Zn-dependent oxidoreductase